MQKRLNKYSPSIWSSPLTITNIFLFHHLVQVIKGKKIIWLLSHTYVHTKKGRMNIFHLVILFKIQGIINLPWCYTGLIFFSKGYMVWHQQYGIWFLHHFWTSSPQPFGYSCYSNYDPLLYLASWILKAKHMDDFTTTFICHHISFKIISRPRSKLQPGYTSCLSSCIRKITDDLFVEA